jgi:hypothetical protein
MNYLGCAYSHFSVTAWGKIAAMLLHKLEQFLEIPSRYIDLGKAISLGVAAAAGGSKEIESDVAEYSRTIDYIRQVTELVRCVPQGQLRELIQHYVELCPHTSGRKFIERALSVCTWHISCRGYRNEGRHEGHGPDMLISKLDCVVTNF